MQTGLAAVSTFRACGVSERGPVRRTNEDCFAIDERIGLCVVADGMGGHNGGEVAARVAVDTVMDFLRASANRPATWPFGFDKALSPRGNVLRTAIHSANAQVLELATSRHQLAGMGTTIVAALVAAGRLSVAHMGDSRLYVRSDGKLRLLTEDDTWPSMRNVLTNVLGTGPMPDVHLTEAPLADGDLLVLVTDGVHGALDHTGIERVVDAGRDPAGIAARLVLTAIARDSRDNCTAVVAQWAQCLTAAASDARAKA
jgi:protein phosphatase